MFVRLGKIAVVFTLILTLSAHWALLQTVAWTGMLAGNLQSGSLHEAMAKTFDGEHPCCLCKVIIAGKSSEQKTQFTMAKARLEFPPVVGNLILNIPSRFDFVPLDTFSVKSVLQQPLTPPPRRFSV